jgi:hypothetical protein
MKTLQVSVASKGMPDFLVQERVLPYFFMP